MQVNYILFQLKPLENHDSLDKIIEYDKGQFLNFASNIKYFP